MRIYFYLSGFIFLTFCILTHSKLGIFYASQGLQLWFSNMIPALLPFMILSGTLVRMNLTEGFTALIYPVIKPVYRVRRNVCYAMFVGFLCGFPMGARCTADLYQNGRLTRDEASFLLTFCNNIGPVYFVSFALPLIGIKHYSIPLFGMYGIPLLYGLLLRYTVFRGKIFAGDNHRLQIDPHNKNIHNSYTINNAGNSMTLGKALDKALTASLQSMTSLGGYMILFNLLMMIPRLYLPSFYPVIAPVLEITGGLSVLGNRIPVYSLIVLSFGGISCIAQTYTCIRDTDLNLRDYVKHKLILTTLSAVYYLLFLRLFRLL